MVYTLTDEEIRELWIRFGAGASFCPAAVQFSVELARWR